MNYDYSWANSDGTIIKAISPDGGIVWIPASEDNTYYIDFLKWCEEGNEPEPYVAPPAPPEPSPEEKLAASGLTVEDLKSLLGL